MSDEYVRVTLDGAPISTDPSPYPIGVVFDMPSHMLDGFAMVNTKECDRALTQGYVHELEIGEFYFWAKAISLRDRQGWRKVFDPVTEEYLVINPSIIRGAINA